MVAIYLKFTLYKDWFSSVSLVEDVVVFICFEQLIYIYFSIANLRPKLM